jgi:hypothetical protein
VNDSDFATIYVMLMALCAGFTGMACTRATCIFYGWDNSGKGFMSALGTCSAGVLTLLCGIAVFACHAGSYTYGQSFVVVLTAVIVSSLCLPAVLIFLALLDSTYDRLARFVDKLMARIKQR